MNKDILKLLKWLVPVLILELLVGGYVRIMLTELFSNSSQGPEEIKGFMKYAILIAGTPGKAITLLQFINIVVDTLPHIVVGIWLWKREKSKGYISILWLVTAILMKYWVLIIYFVYHYSEKFKEQEVENP